MCDKRVNFIKTLFRKKRLFDLHGCRTSVEIATDVDAALMTSFRSSSVDLTRVKKTECQNHEQTES